MNKNYAILIGRFSTGPHVGHQSIINKTIDLGYEPVIFLGSAQEFGTKKNPYHIQDRIKMMQMVYPGIKCFAVEDKPCWDDWMATLTKSIDLALQCSHKDVTIITHNKPEDLQDFEYNNINYTNEYYTKMFEVEGFKIHDLKLSNIPIRASEIREDLESNRHFLDHRVYKFIKELSKK